MADVSIRDLRNHGGDVVDRAARGEQITVSEESISRMAMEVLAQW